MSNLEMHDFHQNPRTAPARVALSCANYDVRAGVRGGNVDFLTPAARRTGSASFNSRLAATLLLLISSVPAALATAEPTTWQSVNDIETTAEAFLAGHMSIDKERTRLSANPLDPRLQLPRCAEPLDAFLPRGTKVSSRMTVGVRCSSARPWKVFVTVNVVVTDDLYVASRTLPSGHVLTAADLKTAERDVSGLTAGYLSRPEQVLGRRLKQNLIAGRVLTPTMLKDDVVIHRGQSVTLTIQSKSLNIRMEGKALMDGHVNQRIRVQNTLSRRVVEGIVRSPQHVEVLVF